MAQPTAYNKTRNFTDWQAANPGTVYAGSDLDQEFNNAEATLDGLCTNLAMIQRDDGKLANLSVHQDALSSAVLALIASTWTPKGLWVTATAYVVGDVVEKAQEADSRLATWPVDRGDMRVVVHGSVLIRARQSREVSQARAQILLSAGKTERA